MVLLHIFILALVQGLTEFLPVSSSGHLVIAWEAFDQLGMAVPEQTMAERLTLDVAVHFGSLLAVLVAFRREIVDMAVGLLLLFGLRMTEGARLAFLVIVATIPLGLVGYFFQDPIKHHLHSIEVVAWSTIGFGLLLWLGDRMGMTLRRLEHMTWASAITIGLAQVLALIPGTSRSGITMTAARFLGFEPAEAARFSLLLSIPAILAPTALVSHDLYQAGNVALGQEAIIAALLAFFTALSTIYLMLAWLRRSGFTPFVIYRLLLGGLLLYWVHSGAL